MTQYSEIENKSGKAQVDAERYYTLQEAIDAASMLNNGHIHNGPVDASTGYPKWYDVCDGESC
jgi:hypothetical protein